MPRMASTPSPFDALKPIAGRALEMALNRAIALDADTRAALARLDGRVVELTLASPPLALQLRVDGDRLAVGPVDTAGEPDLAVRTTLGGIRQANQGVFVILPRDQAPGVNEGSQRRKTVRVVSTGAVTVGPRNTSGTSIVILAPRSSPFSARTVPPWSSTMCLTMARPSPVPPSWRLRAVSIR